MGYFESLRSFGMPPAPTNYMAPFNAQASIPGGSPDVPAYNGWDAPNIGGGFADPAALAGAPTGMMAQFADWARTNGLLDSTAANGVKTQGLAMPALSAIGSIGNGFMALKQYGMAKDALNTSKAQFNKQYAAQRQLTNANLEGRQREMAAAKYGSSTSAAANGDVAAYMSKYGVK